MGSSYTFFKSLDLSRSNGANGFVTELAPPHAQSAWGFRGKLFKLRD